MIENIKDLSAAERAKKENRKRFWTYFLKCIGGVIVATFAMSLFAIFKLTTHFTTAFTVVRAIPTSGRIVSTFILLLFLMITVYACSPADPHNARNFWLILITMTLTFILSISTSDELNRYALPIAICSLVVLELLGSRLSIISTIVLAIIVIISFFFSMDPNSSHTYIMGRVFSAAVCNALSAVVISFLAHKHFSRVKFLLMAITLPLVILPLVATTSLATIVAYNEITETSSILWNSVAFYAANVGSALVFMPFVAIFEGAFNIADDFRLSELCNLSNPLLKRLASEAPGTFNHSLVVGNLAEACASAIGENPHLARCAAYYHDIGKLKAPLYFSENQSTYNPHDELIPEVSVSMITSHTLFGEILAKQNRLPLEVVDICRQHHGTAPVGYFYRKALTLKEDGDLAVDKYTYAGPKPQTKIAAIIMIADTVEAAIRAYMPDTREEYEARINMLIDEKIKLKQFDECPITFGDLAIIRKTVTEALASIHHERVEYDKKNRSRIGANSRK